ncbi:MAG: long-chain fatty acid--CoA ligase, partial [Alistipes sp.]|nr:long-chain fatty acid--CoA ligase [Alistipes sp.]
VQLKMEEIKREVLEYVNSKVNRFSKITKVIDNEGEFEKTPTKKIRRYNLGKNKNKNNGGENASNK